MIIHSIKLFNFGIYAGEQEINFAYDADGMGKVITLIGGLNGRGKTSILEALLLALYGSRSPKVRESGRSYSNYLAELIHGRGTDAKESWVEIRLYLPINNSATTIVLKRAWYRRNVRVKDYLQVWRDGREDPYLAENWESYIEELIPSAIAELFFFDGEQISTLAESEETVESLRRAIRSLLGIETIDRLIKDLGLFIKRHKSVISGNDLMDELQQVNDYIQTLELRHNHLLQERSSLNSKVRRLTQRLEELKRAYFEAGGGYFENQDKLLKRCEELNKELDELKLSAGSILAGAFPLILVKDQIIKVQETAKSDVVKNQAKASLPFITHLSTQIMSDINQLQIDNSDKEKLQKLIVSKIASVEQAASEKPLFPFGLTMSHQLENILNVLDIDKVQTEKIIKRYEDIDHELYQIDKNLPSDPDIDVIKDLLENQKEIEIELNDCIKKISQFDEELKILKSEDEKARQRIIKMSTLKAEADENERIIKYAVQAQVQLRTFRERLILQKVGNLSDSIYEAFDILTHKNSLVTKIMVDPDHFKIMLYDKNGLEISKYKLSSGERQMLALAILWGLAKASGKTLPVVIDTPMGRLDSLHRINFVEKYLPNASHQVVVLSTDTEIEGRYLQILSPHIGKKYLLTYDEAKQATEISEGYLNFHK